MNHQPAHKELPSGTSPFSGDANIQLDELVILGVTETGDVFDIPDWIERLCGMLAVQLRDKRISYSDYLKPAHINGYPAVILLNSLAKDDAESFAVVTQFINDNKLETRPGRYNINSEELPVFQHERREYIKG